MAEALQAGLYLPRAVAEINEKEKQQAQEEAQEKLINLSQLTAEQIKEMKDKFSSLSDTITNLTKSSFGFRQLFRSIFMRKGAELTPSQLREKEKERNLTVERNELLKEIRDALMIEVDKESKTKTSIAQLVKNLGNLKNTDKGDFGFWDAVFAGALVDWIAKNGGVARLLGKTLRIGGLLGVIGYTLYDSIVGYFKSEDWGTRKISAVLGATLGGTGQAGFIGAFKNAGKWAMIGATIGLATPVPFGMVAGAIAGALIGGFAGWFGGESYAKLFDSIISSGNELWNSLRDTTLELLDSLVGWVIDKLKYFRSNGEALNNAYNTERTADTKTGTSSYSATDSFNNSDSSNSSIPQYNLTPSSSKIVPETKSATDNGKKKKVAKSKRESRIEPTTTDNNLGRINEQTNKLREQSSKASKAMASESIINPNQMLSFKPYEIKLAENAGMKAVKDMENDSDTGFDKKEQVYKPYNDVDKDRSLAIAHGHHWIPVDLSDLKGDVSNKLIPLRKVKSTDKLTREQAEKLLEYRFKVFPNKIENSKVGRKTEPSDNYINFYMNLPPAIRSTLANMAFQMGMDTFNKFEGMRSSLKAYTESGEKIDLDKAAGHVKYVNGVDGEHTPLFQQTPIRAEAYQKSIQENKVYTLKYNQEVGERVPTIVPYEGPMAKGFIAKKPSLIMTGEYSGAEENPEVTIQMNALENRILATTNRLFKMKEDMKRKDENILTSTFEKKLERTVENNRSSEERVHMKDMIERQAMQLQMPVMNSVVDNKVINNSTNPILVQRTSKNVHNPFRMS